MPYCKTDRQIEILQTVIKCGSNQKAAAELKLNRRAVDQIINRIKHQAAISGWSPAHDMIRPVPEGFIVKGTSTYYNKDGKPTGQWVKSTIDQDMREIMMREAIEALKDEIQPTTLVKCKNYGNANLCNTYVITDYHLGMLSWREETGADWDLNIAKDLIIKWFQQAIAQSPQAEQCVFAQLSDFLHFDGMDAVTPASKHLLDVDTRFAKLVRVAIHILRIIIDMLRQKYQKVHIIMADANHDPVSQIWLREWLSVFYSNDPKVTVDTSPNPYNAFEFGQVALFFHHGHKRKVENVSEVFAGMFRDMFGRTKYAYAHTGHLHSMHVKENNLMIVEQHRTLAAPDAYASRGGWLSGRDAKVITYDKRYGEVGRVTININMLKD